jgi:chitodextrinase/lysophospholipase L1-like esterase
MRSVSRTSGPESAFWIEPLEPRALLAGSGLAGAYFDRPDLSVTKAARIDSRVNFDFNAEPVPGVGNDFSARWVGRVEPRFSEQYRFILRVQGGARLWVNNSLLIDNWTVHALTNDSGYINLIGGKRYNIRVDYQTSGLPGSARLYWESARQGKEIVPSNRLYSHVPETLPPTTPSGLKGLYASDTALKFKWDPSTDGSEFVVYDVYIGATKVATTTDTTYTRAGRQPATDYTFTVKAIDAFGNSRASKKLVMRTRDPVSSGTGTGLAASYFSGQAFNQFRMTRTDPQVNFAFGSPPVPTSDGTYTVRWRGRVQAKYSEAYTFYVTADDGVKLWVNGQLVIDHWQDHAAMEDRALVTLSAGQRYDIRMDYKQSGGEAVASLSWSSLSQPKQVIASSQLFPAFTDQQAPLPPGGPTVTAVTTNSVSLTWPAASDDVGVVGYDVYRNSQRVANLLTERSFTDTGLSPNTQYSYHVVAIDGTGRASADSPPVIARTDIVPADRNAFNEIRAETHDATSPGVVTSGGHVSDFDDGEWLRFSGMDFNSGGIGSVRVKLALPVNNVGGRIEFRLDSTGGQLLGTLDVQATGSFNTYFWQQTASTNVSGVRDLYLVGRARQDLANLESFQFTTKTLTRVMALGDSITHSFTNLKSYRYYLWQRLQQAGKGVDFVGSQTRAINGPPADLDFDQNHQGHTGLRADEILNNISSWASSARPDVVLIHLGTNDLRASQSPASTISELGQIIDVLRSVNANVKILLAQIIPSGDAPLSIYQDFNSRIPGLASSKSTGQSPVIVVDQFTGFNLSTDTFDSLHPNDSGDQKIASKFYDALVNLL